MRELFGIPVVRVVILLAAFGWMQIGPYAAPKARAQANFETCFKAPAGDEKVKACAQAIEVQTRYIGTSKLRGKKLADALVARATAHYSNDQKDRAISDLTEAIRHDSNNVSAYFLRASYRVTAKEYDRAIADYDEALRIQPNNAEFLKGRAGTYFRIKDYDRAIRDYDAAIRHGSKDTDIYRLRGLAHFLKGEPANAIKDFDEAIRIRPNDAVLYIQRASALIRQGRFDLARADIDKALSLDPRSYTALTYRGLLANLQGRYDDAIRDLDESIRLQPKNPGPFTQRGVALREKGELDRALHDLNEAIRLYPNAITAYVNRGLIYEQKRDLERARSDFVTAAGLEDEAKQQVNGPRSLETARAHLAALDRDQQKNIVQQAKPAKPDPASIPAVSAAPTGARVALVIGNGKYRFAPELPNPGNDARDMAAALRDLGFKVIEGYDLDSAGMRGKIAEFGAAMPGAATTLFFYAGHGVAVAGKNYLIPTDAKLARPSALNIEALEVDTILADMETEKRTNLIFLDACRDNPLSRSLARSFGGTRSSAVGQGLAQVNAGIGTLITFATSPNTVALDGSGRNSPFTTALLRHIRTPNVEVRTLLTRVRADVAKATNEKQIPWDHSSLLGEFYFKIGG